MGWPTGGFKRGCGNGRDGNGGCEYLLGLTGLCQWGRPSFDGTRACGQGQVQHEPLATRSRTLPFAASDGWRAGVRDTVGFVLHKVCLHANGWLVRPASQ